MSKRTHTMTTKKPTLAEQLSAEVKDLRRRAKLNSWNEYVESMPLPSELIPAMMTQRPELIPSPRPMTADEVGTLYSIIGTLMKTHAALREHTEHVAELSNKWVSIFKGLASVGVQINDFANFRVAEDDEPEDDAEG